MRLARPRGIALILTLMVASILCMLAGAFLGVNEANIRLIGSQDLHNKALQAAQGGIEYAKMRIEQCPEWGDPKVYVPGFAALPNEWPVMQVHEVVEGDDDQRGAVYKVVGVLNGGESHFQIILVSPSATNISFYPLEGDAGMFVPETIAANPQGPPGLWSHMSCANIDISVNNAAAKNSDPFLRRDPLEPPAYANATNRTIPPRRARLLVIGYCKGVVKRVEASFGPVELSDSSLASGDDMAIACNEGGQWRITASEGENQVRTNGSFYGPTVNDATEAIQFGSGSGNQGSLKATGEIYLNDSVALDYNEATDTIEISGGGTALTLAEREAAGAAAGGEFQKGSSATMPPIDPEDVENLAGINDSNKKKIAPGRYVFVAPDTVEYYATPSSSPVPLPGSIPSSSGGGAAVHLKDGKFIVPNGTQVNVDGTLEIDSAPGIKPKVAIGFNPGGNLPWKATGVLSVAGDLMVNNGTIVGSGSVVASGAGPGTGKVTIAGNSDMSADPDIGITMYANATVNITPPSPGTYQKIDFEAFKGATEGFNGNNWTVNKQMNSWSKLDIGEKAALVGNLSAAVVNDTQVTAANPESTGNIRTTDITYDLGELNDNNSVLNTLIDQYDFVKEDPGTMANLTALIETYKTGSGTVDGVALDVGDPGFTTGRYIRLREWLRINDDYHKAGGEAVKNMVCPLSAVWADCTNPETNADIAYKVIHQLDYYERQRGNYNLSSLQSFLGRPSNPITSETVDASFRGLIISKANIFCDLANGRFNVDGGMVALKKLAVANATSVDTNYNPQYMKALTKELYAKKGWRRLSITYWSSF